MNLWTIYIYGPSTLLVASSDSRFIMKKNDFPLDDIQQDFQEIETKIDEKSQKVKPTKGKNWKMLTFFQVISHDIIQWIFTYLDNRPSLKKIWKVSKLPDFVASEKNKFFN